jgi:hypothetical protein
MKRPELEHLIRAAADIADDDEIIVIGSQAILGQYPDAPPDLCVSTHRRDVNYVSIERHGRAAIKSRPGYRHNERAHLTRPRTGATQWMHPSDSAGHGYNIMDAPI